MIHWLWLIPAVWVGGAVGFLAASLCITAKNRMFGRKHEQPI